MVGRKYFWRMANGEKIDVDKMSETHLRNVLKLLMREDRIKSRKDKIGVDSFDDTPYCDDNLWK